MDKRLILPTIVSLLFSGSFIAAKYTTTDLKPITTAFLRYAVALVFLTLLLIIKKDLKLPKIRGRDMFKMFLLGLFGIIGYHYFFFLSLHYTSVANTAIINALSPTLTGILAALFIKERLHKLSYIGIFLAFLGVLTLLSKGNVTNILNLSFNFGDLLMLLSVLCWVIYALIIKNMAKNTSSFTLTFYATVSGVTVLFFLMLTEDVAVQLSVMSIRSVFSILYMGVFASGIGYLLYNISIKSSGPTRTAGVVYSLVPLFTSFMGYLVFAQPVTGIMVVSMIMIICGLQLMFKKS